MHRQQRNIASVLRRWIRNTFSIRTSALPRTLHIATLPGLSRRARRARDAANDNGNTATFDMDPHADVYGDVPALPGRGWQA